MMQSSSSSSATATDTLSQGGNTNAPANADPYLLDDFRPLSLASSEILNALRADESAPNADLYRRLNSSTDAGAHRYHIARGENGCGEVDKNNGVGGTSASGGASGAASRGSNGNGGRGQTPSPRSKVIGSPLGVLRGSRQFGSSGRNSDSANTNTANNGVNGSPGSPQSTTVTTPPTSFLKYETSLPLPNHLAAEAKKAQYSYAMGLLTEANLVWLTADDKLFLWSYKASSGEDANYAATTNSHHREERQDYCSFTVPSGQLIVSVGLDRPKPGVFTNSVDWCLVVTTPEEAILCALARESLTSEFNGGGTDGQGGGFRHGSDSLLRLIPTRYVLPTDSCPLLSVCGSKDGRIFLGGSDGCLYEMSYEGNTPGRVHGGNGFSSFSARGGAGNDAMEAAIDDYFDGRGVFSLDDGTNKKHNSWAVLKGGKRVFSALTFGSLDDSSDGGSSSRPRKCRKINHSSSAPGSLSSGVVGAVVRVAAGIFGSSTEAEARKGGPIVSMVLDEERLCLYTLGAKGVICTYDLAPLPSNSSGGGNPSPNGSVSTSAVAAPPRLASVLDAPATAQLYLDSVSRERMYPPSTNHLISLGTITFPGGIFSAVAGVGGMKSAQDILKRWDSEQRILKASGVANSSLLRKNDGKEWSNTAGILDPVSIHLVPTSQSKSLTLVAITGGGLRYYLSSLSSTYINNGGGFDYARGGSGSRGGMDPRLVRTRPSRKMMFCHVRAPPPYTSPGGNDGLHFELSPSALHYFSRNREAAGGGLPPGIHNMAGKLGSAVGGGGRNGGSSRGDVVKSYYGNGMFVMAVDVEQAKSERRGSSRNNFYSAPSDESGSSEPACDAIVVALPDFAARLSPSLSPNTSSANGYANSNMQTATPATTTNSTPGGISETIELPMSGVYGTTSPVLPGGRTFDIVTKDGADRQESSVAILFKHSETPSDVELQVGLMPSFTPAQKRQNKKHAPTSTSSTALVVSNDRGRGMISSAMSALSFYLRSGQGHGYQVSTVSQGSNNTGFGPSVTYRVSFRHGCDSAGFSNSAGEGSTSSRMRSRRSPSPGAQTATSAKSARLPSWLLRPSAAPLNEEASQHLTNPGSKSGVLILNSGGLHFFTNSSLLNNLASTLLRATNVAKDVLIQNFFISYGYVEGCAMCFALATSSSSSIALRNKAEQAVLCYANRPVMKLINPSNTIDVHHPITSYTFQPSSLYEGLVRFLSRLLRPFWYKPAVIVTEGRPIHSKSAYANYYASLPAKVELLLDAKTLDELRRPLVLLQNLMREKFDLAVIHIPGGDANKQPNDEMDIDGGNNDGNSSGGGLITRAMQNQSRAAAQRLNGASQHATTVNELETIARRTEERNMHSLYRLLSRCVQLLNLISCLEHAHSSPALPEVQWGLLHGLTFYQLATSQEGQQRTESLLNALVCRGGKTLVNGMSTDGDLLADKLSRQCYLFFSSASRLTYLGFRSANDALSRPSNSPQRIVLANQAASYLRSASRHWYAPGLVAGNLLSNNHGGGEQVDWEVVAMSAIESGSPLALAADILMKLGNVEGLAELCLICAANFGGSQVPRNESKELGEDAEQDMLKWEKGLYHRPPSAHAVVGVDGMMDSRSNDDRAIMTGIDVTPSDALRTCHSIIFHYISKLLREAGKDNQRLAEKLVATCAASSDTKFLHSLYEHLLATNHVDTALRIDSSSLEKWLLEEKKDVDLLWKHYTFHDRHVLAGKIMRETALETTEDSKIPLHRRIECLTRAANSFDLALRGNRTGSDLRRPVGVPGGYFQGGLSSQPKQEQQVTAEMLQSWISQIKEQIDVATIQERVLTTIVQSQDANLEAAKMDALEFSLVNVSDLYNDYAGPLNLFDICLCILATCNHNEADSIHKLWKSIICEEVLPCHTSSESAMEFLGKLKQGSMLEEETIVHGAGNGGDALPKFENGEWIPRLRNRVAALGKELFGKGADYTFPLDLIVRELEGLRQVYDSTREEGHVSLLWPAQTMLDVDVSFYALFESYDSLQQVENAAIGGVDIATQLPWISSMSELLEMWVTAALSSYGSSSMIGLNSLYGKGQGNDASSQLTRGINTGGLLQRIRGYRSALEGLSGRNTATAALVNERLAKIDETIRKEFIQL